MAINWGIAYPQQQGNAMQGLAQGFQLGSAARQQREQKEARNALADYVANPTREGLAGIAPHYPQITLQENQRYAQQDAVAAKEREADMRTFRQLLSRAAQSPEGWAQAMADARALELDVSRVPSQYDRAWAEQQLRLMDVLSDPEAVDQIDRDLRRLGFTDPNQQGYAEAAIELTLLRNAKQTTDEYGRPTLVMPEITLPSGGGNQPTEQAPQWGEGNQFTFDQFRANVAAMGPERALENMRRNGLSVRISSAEEYNALPPGALYVNPDTGQVQEKQ